MCSASEGLLIPMSETGLELSEGDQSVILANTVENGDHQGQLAQLRARVLHLVTSKE